MENRVEILKYVMRFASAFLVLLILFSALQGLLKNEPSSGLTVVAFIAAAAYAMSTFLRHNKRVLTESEKTRLVWFSFAASWIISVAEFGVVAYWYPDVLQTFVAEDGFSVPMFITAVVFFSLTQLAGLYVVFGVAAEKEYQRLQKTGKM